MSEQGWAQLPTAITHNATFPGKLEGATTPAIPQRHQVNMQEPDDDMNTSREKPFDDMSVEELRKQQEEIDQKIRQKREAQKKAIIDQIVEVVHTYEIPLDELVDALGGLKVRRKGIKAVQKYSDPATGATWSGRGKEPIWIRGKDRRLFEIPDTEK